MIVVSFDEGSVARPDMISVVALVQYRLGVRYVVSFLLLNLN